MQLRTLNLIAAVVAALPLAAHAGDFSYRNVDLAHFPSAKIDSGSVDVDGSGLQLRGALIVR